MNQEELVRSLGTEHVLWARQAADLMFSFKNQEALAKVVPYLMNRVLDRHNRFALVGHQSRAQRQLLTKISQKMGKGFLFNYWNPNGHYELNLANPVERDVAVTLLVMNKEAAKRIGPGDKADRSQVGNKSFFRNERYNTKTFVMAPDWQLPHNGIFEFDFMYLLDVPDAA